MRLGIRCRPAQVRARHPWEGNLRYLSTFGLALAAMALVASPVLTAAPSYAKIPAYITAAVADPNRPATDTKRDANRKPAETVAFAGVKPGDRVLELMPGRGYGYFTKILSKVVGPKGWVYSLIPSELDPLFAKNNIKIPPPPDANFPNVSFLHIPLDKIVVPESVDLVWTSQNYHDFHNDEFGKPDMGAVNKGVYDALKPGGIYFILDHAAEAGSGTRDTDTLHRIDPAVVKKEVEAAGFVFAGESKVLHNPKDDHTKKVFDSSIRGETDQFIFKFRKPGKK
jgi:predicted methyltransferase